MEALGKGHALKLRLCNERRKDGTERTRKVAGTSYFCCLEGIRGAVNFQKTLHDYELLQFQTVLKKKEKKNEIMSYAL